MIIHVGKDWYFPLNDCCNPFVWSDPMPRWKFDAPNLKYWMSCDRWECLKRCRALLRYPRVLLGWSDCPTVWPGCFWAHCHSALQCLVPTKWSLGSPHTCWLRTTSSNCPFCYFRHTCCARMWPAAGSSNCRPPGMFLACSTRTSNRSLGPLAWVDSHARPCRSLSPDCRCCPTAACACWS